MPDYYRHLVERSPDGILVLRNDRLVMANPAAARLCGAETAERMVGIAAARFFTPQTQPVVQACLDRLRAGGDAERVDASIATDTGERIVEIAAAPLPDGAIELVLRDVTGSRLAEARLRESEERLELAVAGAREGVWDLDLGSVRPARPYLTSDLRDGRGRARKTRCLSRHALAPSAPARGAARER